MNAIGIYESALTAFETDKQCIVALEELSEVQKEICKVLRGKGSVYHLAEEIADARIMLDQLELAFDLTGWIEHWRDSKLARLETSICQRTEGKA